MPTGKDFVKDSNLVPMRKRKECLLKLLLAATCFGIVILRGLSASGLVKGYASSWPGSKVYTDEYVLVSNFSDIHTRTKRSEAEHTFTIRSVEKVGDRVCLHPSRFLLSVQHDFQGKYLEDYIRCSQRFKHEIEKIPSAVTTYLGSEKCINYRMNGFTANKTKNLGTGRRIRCYKNDTDSEFRREHGGGLIISKKFKLIYIPNMKAASQMFKQTLETRFEAEKINQHNLGDFLQENNDLLEDYLVFTFVRDPLSHFLSAYAEVDKQKMKKAKRMNHTWGYLNIPRNLTHEPARSIRLINDIRNGTFWGFTASHLYSQFWKTTRCLTDNHLPLLPNFVGRIENLEQDWQAVEDYLKVGHVPLEKKHYYSHPAKKHAKMLDLYSTTDGSKYDVLVKEICHFYKADYECFGYELPKSCQE
mmetsp:Transcript_15719/g.20675  ORF Transcript_15719/g.20675 Transcript_15719/m.20675 type:complete len:417 (-) Transcript_15719:71-1321(-)|eukprot:CAMPEP_0184039528 /NCGR_PEP_ID=MMETSP0955-20130417/53119_1 /TAXON_ID=627963 /ORGANISM="Aplanochytrium sp, Strain PBS07" /LENGTH=416 /DNA_ID=CAMNT_0026328777 /DNA_START=100 /DNA_END=1350 /DNA_ORIENTATION=-